MNIVPDFVLDIIFYYHISNRCSQCHNRFKEIICLDCSSPLCADCTLFCHKCSNYICHKCTTNNQLNSSITCAKCYRESLLTKCTICDQDIYTDNPDVSRCETCSYHNEYLCSYCGETCTKCGTNSCTNCVNKCDVCWQKLCHLCMGDGTCRQCLRHYFCTECLAENDGICIECVDINNENNEEYDENEWGVLKDLN